MMHIIVCKFRRTGSVCAEWLSHSTRGPCHSRWFSNFPNIHISICCWCLFSEWCCCCCCRCHISSTTTTSLCWWWWRWWWSSGFQCVFTNFSTKCLSSRYLTVPQICVYQLQHCSVVAFQNVILNMCIRLFDESVVRVSVFVLFYWRELCKKKLNWKKEEKKKQSKRRKRMVMFVCVCKCDHRN